jgi:large subunit ribosomal protein L21
MKGRGGPVGIVAESFPFTGRTASYAACKKVHPSVGSNLIFAPKLRNPELRILNSERGTGDRERETVLTFVIAFFPASWLNQIFRLGGDIVYAVIMSGGKQYRVAEGEVVRVEKLEAESEAPVEFKEVLLVKTEEKTYIGEPLVEGASVTGVLKSQGKSDKVLVFKYKKKKQYRRTRGHRQPYSAVLIEKINLAG